MACFIASFARGESLTVPTILHQPGRSPSGKFPRVPLGLSTADYQAVVDGLERVIGIGTGKLARVEGVRVAGKTGTAQIKKDGKNLNVAWFICFAPVEKPEIAIAIALEGGDADVEYGGGRYSAPVAKAVLQEYFSKKERRSGIKPVFNLAPQP